MKKPKNYISSEAVLGLYFYNNEVIDLIEQLGKSERNELEITDLNNLYIESSRVKIHNIGRGITWFDAGTINDLQDASNFIQNIENRQETIISSIEEIAYRKGYISEDSFIKLANDLSNSDYGKKLLKILN